MNTNAGIKGAGTGAMVGSAFGPMGTLAGGVIGGAIGLFGGDEKSYDDTAGQNRLNEMAGKYDTAYKGNQNDINRITNQGQTYADQGSWQNKLNAANSLRQNANKYEINQATQAGLAAYGGSPLSGNARSAVSDRQQQMARANWQTSLQNASSMIDTTTNQRLGVNQQQLGATTQNNMQNMQQIYNTGMKRADLAQGINNANVELSNTRPGFMDSVGDAWSAYKGGKM